MNNLSFPILDNVLWASGFLFHLALLAVLVYKRHTKQFPVFCSRIVYQIIETIVLFGIARYGTRSAYAMGYWIFAAGDYLFQLAVIFELSCQLLRPQGVWIRKSLNSFLLWSIAGMLLAAGVSISIAPPGHSGLYLWSIRSTIFTSILTCEVFLAMAASANRLRLRWSYHSMAIGQGLTVWAIVSLIEEVAHLSLGWQRDIRIFDYVREFVYLGSLVFWIFAFWRPGRVKPEPSENDLREYLSKLQQCALYEQAEDKYSV